MEIFPPTAFAAAATNGSLRRRMDTGAAGVVGTSPASAVGTSTNGTRPTRPRQYRSASTGGSGSGSAGHASESNMYRYGSMHSPSAAARLHGALPFPTSPGSPGSPFLPAGPSPTLSASAPSTPPPFGVPTAFPGFVALPSPSRTTLTVPATGRRSTSTPSTPLPWTFPTSSPGDTPPASSISTVGPTPPAHNAPRAPSPTGATPRRHAHSLSASPSPTPPYAASPPLSAVALALSQPQVQSQAQTQAQPQGSQTHAHVNSARAPARRGSSASTGHIKHGPATFSLAPLQPAAPHPGAHAAQPAAPNSAYLQDRLSRQNSTSNLSGMMSIRSEDAVGMGIEEAHPLQAEIDRLVDGCSQHELRFRSARASFDHRVFTEFPSLLNELNEIDDRAERITAKLYTAIKDSKPRLQLRLDSIVQQGEETVLKMQKRTTPWRSLIAKGEAEEEKAAPNAAEAQGEDEKETGVSEGTASATSSRKSSLVAYGGVGLQRTRSGDRRSIARIERIANGSTPNPDDRAIAYMQEQWGTDTILRYRSQITALRGQLHSEGYRRIMVMRCLLTLGGLLIVALMVLVIIRAPSTALDDEL